MAGLVDVIGLQHPPYHSPIATTLTIDMAVAPWAVEIPASAMTDGFFLQFYSWQLPIQHVSDETVNVTATGLPEGLSVSPTGLVSGYPRHDVHHPVTFTVTARPVGAPWVIERSVSLPLTIWYHS